MGFLVTLGVWAALWLISYALRKSTAEEAVSQQIERVPRTEKGVPVPWAFGRNRIDAANTIWSGNYHTTQFISGDQAEDVGEPYSFANIQFGLSLSNIHVDDTSGEAEARLVPYGVWAEDTRNTAGSWVDITSHRPQPVGVSSFIVDISLSEHSYVFGLIEFNSGRWDTTKGYFATQAFTAAGLDPAYIPPYRGTVNCMFASDAAGPGQGLLHLGSSYQIPRLAVEFINPCYLPGTGTLEMNDGDANPIMVLYALLTLGRGRLPVSPAKIDTDSFHDAAVKLFLEQNGMSGVVYRGETGEALVEKICDQIEGVFYEDPQTLLLTIKLIRDDYDAEDLVELDRSFVTSEPEFTMMTYMDTRNLVRVRFVNRELEYTQDEVEAPDQANFEVTGTVREETYDMPWVTNRANAARIASRVLRSLSVPLARVKFGAKRNTVFWVPGYRFKYTHPTNGKTFIMIVQRVDTGTDKTGEVVIDAIQDRWSVNHTVTVPPESVAPAVPLPPLPQAAELITEAPRWILRTAELNGPFPDPDGGRMMYLAAPPHAGSTGVSYQGYLDILLDGQPEAKDTPRASFTGAASVAVAYSRESDPLDTTEGLEIEGLTNWTPEAATTDDIRIRGHNLIMVGQEIMAFTDALDLGGGHWLLMNVYRGLCDTATVAHEVGETVFVLELRNHLNPDWIMSRIGHLGVEEGDEVEVRLIPSYGTSLAPESEFVATAITVRRRPLLPYPIADLQGDYNGAGYAKLLPDIEEDGIDLTWLRRERLTDTIVLGTAADEVPSEGTHYIVYAKKAGDTERNVTGNLSGTSYAMTPTAPAGHGEISLMVRSVNTATGRTSWQDPALSAFYFPWRNLVLNPNFQRGGFTTFTRWDTISGVPVVSGGGAGSILGIGYVIGTSGDDPTEWRQRIWVKGYRPSRMKAVLTFKIKGFTDTNDTVEADCQSLSAAFATLQTATMSATTAIGQWDKKTLEITNLHADTDQLQVRFEQRPVSDVGDTTSSGVVSDVQLIVGQFTDQLLTNPSLSGTTSWTVDAGSFTTGTTNPAEGSDYIVGGANAINTIHRDESVPTGFQHGWAVHHVATRFGSSGYTGTATVTIQARTSGGTVLALSSENVALVSDLGWWRTRVFCAVPRGATVIRVILSSSVPSGTANQVHWDDGAMRIHKYLDSQHELPYDFSLVNEQALPRSAYQWGATYPDISTPMYGIFNGTLEGGTGREPMMRIDSGAYLSRIFMPQEHTAYEFREGAGAVVRARSNYTYANFTSAQSFTVRVVFSPHTNLEDYGLCGRLGATTGWKLEVSGGFARARLFGDGDIVSVTSTAVERGGPTFVALVYNAVANTLRVVTPSGSSSTSTAGMGQISCSELIPFCIGDATMTDPVTMTGVIASVEIWQEVIDYTDLQDIWVWGTPGWDPAGSIFDAGNALSCSCIVGENDDGQVLGEFIANSAGIWAEVGGVRGFPSAPARTNMVPPNVNTSSGWGNVGSPTVNLNAIVGPNGRREVKLITGDASNGHGIFGLNIDDGLPVNVSFMVRGEVDDTGYLAILDDSNGACSDPIPFDVTTSWTRVDLQEIEITGGTPTRVVFFPAITTRTIYLAGPFWVDQDDATLTPPVAIPNYGSSSSVYLTTGALSLNEQFHDEGEMEVHAIMRAPNVTNGVLGRLMPGSDDDDHTLRTTANTVHFDHKDGAGTAVTSEVSQSANWNTLQVVRGRWNFCGLLDAANAFAGLVTSAGADYDRTATWTPGNDSYSTIFIGHAGGGDDAFNGLIHRLTVRSRESILPASL